MTFDDYCALHEEKTSALLDICPNTYVRIGKNCADDNKVGQAHLEGIFAPDQLNAIAGAVRDVQKAWIVIDGVPLEMAKEEQSE